MKTLKLMYCHYTEVVLPKLAEELKLPILWKEQFEAIVCNLLQVKFIAKREDLIFAISFFKMLVNCPEKIKHYLDLTSIKV